MSRRAFCRLNRRSQRPDANQGDVDRAAKMLGAHVEPGECWDRWVCFRVSALIAGYQEMTIVIPVEVKDGAKPPSARRLTDREWGFALRWPGPGAIVLGPDELALAIDAARRGVLPSARAAAEAYRDATEPGWRQREAVELADEVLG